MKNIKKVDCVFALLEQAAGKGARCPTNPDIATHLRTRGFPAVPSSIPSITRKLVEISRIVVCIYARNWRTVTICTGPLAGKATMPPPDGGKPRTVLDADGLAKLARSKRRSRGTA
jgi:hypothetical protein